MQPPDPTPQLELQTVQAFAILNATQPGNYCESFTSLVMPDVVGSGYFTSLVTAIDALASSTDAELLYLSLNGTMVDVTSAL
jgi:hypothetical protein